MCIESRCIRGFAKIIIPPLHLYGAPPLTSVAAPSSAPPAIAARKVGYRSPSRRLKSTTPSPTTAPYELRPDTAKLRQQPAAWLWRRRAGVQLRRRWQRHPREPATHQPWPYL